MKLDLADVITAGSVITLGGEVVHAKVKEALATLGSSSSSASTSGPQS